MKFKLVAFDLDGTLIELNLPFYEIRKALGIKERFILEAIMEEKDEKKREKMLEILKDFEIKSAMNARRAYFAKEIVDALGKHGIVRGVITRNSRKSVDIVSKRLGFEFDFVITREDAKPKPSPEPMILAMKMFGVDANQSLMVGDFIFDLISGKRAGAKTALIVTKRNSSMVKSFIPYADYVFNSLKELAEFLEVIG